MVLTGRICFAIWLERFVKQPVQVRHYLNDIRHLASWLMGSVNVVELEVRAKFEAHEYMVLGNNGMVRSSYMKYLTGRPPSDCPKLQTTVTHPLLQPSPKQILHAGCAHLEPI